MNERQRGAAGFLAAMLLALIPLVCNGCAHSSASGPAGNQKDVTVVIEPQTPLRYDLRMVVFDFAHHTEIKGLGAELSRQVSNELLLKRFVREIDQVKNEVRSCEEAISFGRKQGYDLVLYGELTEFLYGGLSADSQVSASIKIIDPHDGATLWYLTGSRSDAATGFLDFILVWRESKEAESPYQLSRKLAQDMIEIIAASRYFQPAGEKDEEVK